MLSLLPACFLNDRLFKLTGLKVAIFFKEFACFSAELSREGSNILSNSPPPLGLNWLGSTHGILLAAIAEIKDCLAILPLRNGRKNAVHPWNVDYLILIIFRPSLNPIRIDSRVVRGTFSKKREGNAVVRVDKREDPQIPSRTL